MTRPLKWSEEEADKQKPILPEVPPTKLEASPDTFDESEASSSQPLQPRFSIWSPELSQARISVIGGGLVLGGLAFTLVVLGLPAWTLLTCVFAFAALLYVVSRGVQWPVSGALRGVSYGVSALGLGSMAQMLPAHWGPQLIMLGLLALSGTFAWDGWRRKEPLLGLTAVGGAALSTWMLADDLGALSIAALAVVYFMAALALSGGRIALAQSLAQVFENPRLDIENDTENKINEPSADQPETWSIALNLLLLVIGILPLGWLITVLAHSSNYLAWNAEAQQYLLQASGFSSVEAGLVYWLILAIASSLPAFILLRHVQTFEKATQDVRFFSVFATLTGQMFVVSMVGLAVAEYRNQWSLGSWLGLISIALVFIGIALWAWQKIWNQTAQSNTNHQDSENASVDSLTSALANTMTSSASALVGTGIWAFVGIKAQPTAFAGLGLILLQLGLFGRSMLWTWLGLFGLLINSANALFLEHKSLSGLLITALPVVMNIGGVLRTSLFDWLFQKAQMHQIMLMMMVVITIPLCALVMPYSILFSILIIVASIILWSLSYAQKYLSKRMVQFIFIGMLTILAIGSSYLLTSMVAVPMDFLNMLLTLFTLLLAGGALLNMQKLVSRNQAWYEGIGLLVVGLALSFAMNPVFPAFTLPLIIVAILSASLKLNLPTWRTEALLLAAFVASILALLTPQYNALINWIGIALLFLFHSLILTQAGHRVLQKIKPLRAFPQLPVFSVQVVLSVMMLGLVIISCTLISPAAWDKVWWLLSSVLALLIGVWTCWKAKYQQHAKIVWQVGMVIVCLAGAKALLIDSIFYVPKALVVVGLAVLITGLSLLLIAVIAPKPK